MTDLRDDLRRASRLAPPPREAFDQLEGRRSRKHRRERMGAAALGLTLTVALVAGGVWVAGGLRRGGNVHPGGGGSTRPARDLTMGPDQLSYQKVVVVIVSHSDQGVVPGQVVFERWWALDGSGRIKVDQSDDAYGLPDPGTYGPGQYPHETDLSGLSTDPGTLADQIRERSGPGGSSPQPAVTPGPGQEPTTGGLWRALVDLLDEPNATPALRAALFTVGQGITGVETLSGVQDPVGRPAVALRITTEGARHEIFFDPSTLQPMAFTDAGLDGTWNGTMIVAEAGFTANTTDTPQGDQRFFPPMQGPVPSPSGSLPDPVLSPGGSGGS